MTSSCSTKSTFIKRSLASRGENLNCSRVMSSFKDYKYYSVVGTHQKYNIYKNDLEFSKEIRNLDDDIRWWLDFGNRQYSQKHIQDNYAYSKIRKLMDLEGAFNVARSIRTLFEDVETSFFISKNSFDHKISLMRLREDAKFLELDQIITRLKEVHTLDGYKFINKDSLKELSREKIITRIEREIVFKEDLIIEWGMKLQKYLGMYRVTRQYLEKASLGEDHAVSSKAVSVLERLETSKLLRDCISCGNTDSLVKPEIEDIDNYVSSLKVVQIKSLEKQKRFEIVMGLIARAPSTLAAGLVDSTLKRLKWIKKTIFRKELRALLLDNLETIKYFPVIDSIVLSKESDKNLAEAFLNEFSKRNDVRLLLTLERRIDTFEVREKIYNYYKAQPENIHYVKIAKLMDEAREDAKNLTMFMNTHLPDQNMGVRFIADLAFLYTAGYLGYQSVEATLQEVEDQTGIDIIKAQELERAMQQSIAEQALESQENIDISPSQIEEVKEIIDDQN